MQYKESIQLNVMRKQDFAIPMAILIVALVMSALLSSQAVLLIALLVLTFAAGRKNITLYFFNISEPKLTLIIFQDGSLKIESECEGTIEGYLFGQQWCSHSLAVLSVISGSSIKRMVLSAHQQSTGDFRRLSMWLRQDFSKDIRESLESGV